MRIGELAARTGATARQIRFYEAAGLISSTRKENNYRDYPERAATRVEQILGLLDAGLSIRMVGAVIPCLDRRDLIHFTDITPEMTALLDSEREKMDRRIAVLTRNRDAVASYLNELKALRAADIALETAPAAVAAAQMAKWRPAPGGPIHGHEVARGTPA